MSEHIATIKWQKKQNELFVDNKYSRCHEWKFDGGVSFAASPSPQVVPMPYSDERFVDPEEAFVASLSSCHMLFFLQIAAKEGFVVQSYVDDAVGYMGKNESGNISMLKVSLRPLIEFSGENIPLTDKLEAMHHKAHSLCFLANSVKTEVVTEIRT